MEEKRQQLGLKEAYQMIPTSQLVMSSWLRNQNRILQRTKCRENPGGWVLASASVTWGKSPLYSHLELWISSSMFDIDYRQRISVRNCITQVPVHSIRITFSVVY